MNLKIGDLVRFVDEPIEGYITSFQDNDIIGVTDDKGFEIPELRRKVTLVHGNMRTIEDELDEVPARANMPFVDKGIFVGVAGYQKDRLGKFFIIRDTSHQLFARISNLSATK